MDIEKRVRKEGGHMSYYIDVCPCSVVCAPRPPAASSACPAPCSVVCVPRPRALQHSLRAPPPAASSACPAPCSVMCAPRPASLQRRLRAPPHCSVVCAPRRSPPRHRHRRGGSLNTDTSTELQENTDVARPGDLILRHGD